MTEKNPMTPEEVKNNYQFIVTKKILKKEYPWIKDILVPETYEDVNKFGIIFLNFVVDPWELAKEKDWRVAWYVKNYVTNPNAWGRFWTPYLSTMFSNQSGNGPTQIGHDIEDQMRKIRNSPAIPSEYKLPEGRTFGNGSWFLSPDAKFVEEYTASPSN